MNDFNRISIYDDSRIRYTPRETILLWPTTCLLLLATCPCTKNDDYLQGVRGLPEHVGRTAPSVDDPTAIGPLRGTTLNGPLYIPTLFTGATFDKRLLSMLLHVKSPRRADLAVNARALKHQPPPDEDTARRTSNDGQHRPNEPTTVQKFPLQRYVNTFPLFSRVYLELVTVPVGSRSRWDFDPRSFPWSSTRRLLQRTSSTRTTGLRSTIVPVH